MENCYVVVRNACPSGAAQHEREWQRLWDESTDVKPRYQCRSRRCRQRQPRLEIEKGLTQLAHPSGPNAGRTKGRF